MKRISRSENGFGAVEAVIVFVVIILIGIVGYVVYKHDHKASYGSTHSTSVNPYAGWKTYSSKYVNFSFKYPTSWQVNDSNSSYSPAKDEAGGVLAASNDDEVDITSNDGFQMTINYQNNGGGVIGYQSIVFNEPVNIDGSSAYLDFFQGEHKQASSINGFSLSTSSTNANDPVKHDGYLLSISGYAASNESTTNSQKDPDYTDARLTVSSIKF